MVLNTEKPIIFCLHFCIKAASFTNPEGKNDPISCPHDQFNYMLSTTLTIFAAPKSYLLGSLLLYSQARSKDERYGELRVSDVVSSFYPPRSRTYAFVPS